MEELINRARTNLSCGASVNEVAEAMVKSGVAAEEAYLAIKAAQILLQDVRVTIPDSPGSKNPCVSCFHYDPEGLNICYCTDKCTNYDKWLDRVSVISELKEKYSKV